MLGIGWTRLLGGETAAATPPPPRKLLAFIV